METGTGPWGLVMPAPELIGEPIQAAGGASWFNPDDAGSLEPSD